MQVNARARTEPDPLANLFASPSSSIPMVCMTPSKPPSARIRSTTSGSATTSPARQSTPSTSPVPLRLTETTV
eukprot:8336519-Pyramimonas_sp.AAC.1